jgi:hypothetical protein
MGDAYLEQGSPPRDVIERALVQAIRDLVIPGFAHFGLPTEPIATWLANGAPT